MGAKINAIHASRVKAHPASSFWYNLFAKSGARPPMSDLRREEAAMPDAEYKGYASTMYVPVKNFELLAMCKKGWGGDSSL
jgi:hypothetical protein